MAKLQYGRFTAVLCALLMLLAIPVRTNADDTPAIGVKVGQMYPDFILPTLDGDLARLSDYRGKKILLFHFASW